jgi:hypothetical protein
MLALLLADGTAIPHAGVLIWLCLAAVPVSAIGWIIGLCVVWPMLGTLAARLQGAPFNVGDQVWILTGQHKNTIATVDDVWEERGQVRLELPSEDDVYCEVTVCVQDAAERSAFLTLLTGGTLWGAVSGIVACFVLLSAHVVVSHGHFSREDVTSYSSSAFLLVVTFTLIGAACSGVIGLFVCPRNRKAKGRSSQV